MSAHEGSSSPWNRSVLSLNEDMDEDDEMDWEEVEVPTARQELQVPNATAEPPTAGPSTPLEITLDVKPKKPDATK